jgi:hypothetical protein
MTDGNAIRRVSLTAGVVEEITFENVQNIGLALMSDSAILAYKINDEITLVTDADSNYLNGNIGINAVNIYKPFEIQSLWVVSSVDCDIQWEIRR